MIKSYRSLYNYCQPFFMASLIFCFTSINAWGADFSGIWSGTWYSGGLGTVTGTINQNGNTLSGTVNVYGTADCGNVYDATLYGSVVGDVATMQAIGWCTPIQSYVQISFANAYVSGNSMYGSFQACGPGVCYTGTFSLTASTQLLSIAKTGSGQGTITSSPTGISCNSLCSASTGNFRTNGYVTLTASASIGGSFLGWGSDCSICGSTQSACTVNMNAAKFCTANFSCVSLVATYATLPPTGSSSTITLGTSTSPCSWTATSNAAWITITGGSSGTGNGTVTYNVAANTGAVRTGTITIAGQTFTVIQGTTSTLGKIGVFWNGSWYFDMNGSGTWNGAGQDTVYADFGKGLPNAIPVVGDWDNTGIVRIGVYSEGSWYFDMNGNGQWDGPTIDRTYADFGKGLTGAIPVVGNWEGTGGTRIGVYWNGHWYLDRNGNGQWDNAADINYPDFGVGLTGAIPVVGNWAGSSGTGDKIGVFWNGKWYLDKSGNGAWDGISTDSHYPDFGVGLTGAIPVVGDWTGSGSPRIGVYWNGSWYFDMDGNGAWNGTSTDRNYVDFGKGLTGAWPVIMR